MKTESIIRKSKILSYLEYASDTIDIHKFLKWLEVMSDGDFYVTKGKKPNLSISQQLKRRM